MKFIVGGRLSNLPKTLRISYFIILCKTYGCMVTVFVWFPPIENVERPWMNKYYVTAHVRGTIEFPNMASNADGSCNIIQAQVVLLM